MQQSDPIPAEALVLVAIVPQVADLERARNEHWYRIPLAKAPAILGCEYIAFYQTAAHGAERWSVRYIAAIQAVQICRRIDLLPEQAQHPRAQERYYRFNLGPIQTLPVVIPSQKLRRVSFIISSYSQLLRASDLRELWQAPELVDPDIDELWGAGFKHR